MMRAQKVENLLSTVDLEGKELVKTQQTVTKNPVST